MSFLTKKADALLGWVDARFPLTSNVKAHLTEYYAPKNFNFWYFFGSLALLVLVLQIVTGIFLTMHYKPEAAMAFASVEYIMRDVPWGWLIRYMHSTGASLFFVVIYLHMFRGLLYGSYRNPRELIWLFGVGIFLALMGEAFFGYLLPWGQMSYWGAQVITSLFGTVPFIGPDIAEWLRGDYLTSDATLNRFFAFHVIALPLVIIGLVAAHIIALHEVGSNNPDGVEIKKVKDKTTGIPLDGIPFHPYYSVKDLVGVVVFLIVFAAIIFFAPEMGGYFLEANNFVPADPLVTPAHIAPTWYFTPYYSILRAVPPIGISQFPGVAAMGLSVIAFAFLPWLDRSPVKSIRYKGNLYKGWLTAFVVSFLVLGYLGTVPADVWGQFGAWMGKADIATVVARIFSAIYFLFFILMPWYSKKDKTKPVPTRVTG
ncbi:cytochrome bc complex cytochrome b subunit [Methylotenera sp.]|uniref:cytochrome b n=2 Tax=Methylotenera sp. TaxID=2051956 RepID=UPI002717CC09|nr:cytochrome bc complex cytochrome b subunit [Methylotenera sp.]MDO9204914.1 cytochrome bc complex cytochrome b subunit [Methylotenera sp.]MDP1523811.1 cytochrome bc complex cytochrome b subunit [Methylotenera sp.]MDP2070181.1 cytochrome bc complex cytochrome b subunit [Methylotenera sp.]MDP2231980.1 cytochrome bc complex cytochrome b subunit [Methylotenera sp.]MDP3007351.1 cytochrome bc complex cytochrome b subunit [Methylotenera sp.]